MSESDDNLGDPRPRATRHAMLTRRLPESTYRVQFHARFTFRDAAAIVPYLHDLGITHLYASPYLKARKGSTHGYDVIDHGQLNPELGTAHDYDALVGALHAHDMGQILDIVPNHMGVATAENALWNDVLARGRGSQYARFFDIAWRGSPGGMRDKVLLPTLGKPYAQALEDGELRLVHESGSYFIAYFDRRFPVSPGSIGACAIDEALARFNGTPGDPASFDAFDQLLQRQHYRLAWWRVGPQEINYRRFFDINDLAALRMERREVFDEAHRLVFRLVTEGKVDGLRIDHPDGLYDPAEYFGRLQRCAAGGQHVYVVAEKILGSDERLPGDWPIAGTSGYDFLNMLNGLFVDNTTECEFDAFYTTLVGPADSFGELVYQKKLLILDTSLVSDLEMLTSRLHRLARSSRYGRDFTRAALREALRQTIACFPVYRSYITDNPICEADRRFIETAIRNAAAHARVTDPSVFEYLKNVLLLEEPRTRQRRDRARARQFVAKFQQLTAPTMAKGMEDTAFYIYNRLTSLNEVGGDPGRFGIAPERLHQYLRERQEKWPRALSPLSTHDTKRSEDVRARLNVLSEIPREWADAVTRWMALNEERRVAVRGQRAPDRNEEYLLYQALIGAWPLSGWPECRADFTSRIQQYLTKAMREAKIHTTWTDPVDEYESAVLTFARGILEDEAFLADVTAFQRKVAHFGLLNSLAQTLLRLTAPGAPDTYQGTELWDFSLVDPDNRRPVDYQHRQRLLDSLKGAVVADRKALARALFEKREDGRIKLYVTWQTLTLRRERPGLFSEGDYIPLEARGERGKHLFAFARVSGPVQAIVIAPRMVAGTGFDCLVDPVGDWWQDTALMLPSQLIKRSLAELFTGMILSPEKDAIHLKDVLSDLPFALLIHSDQAV